MKLLPHFILLLLILMGLVVGAAAIVDGGGTAQVHPEFKSMFVGGDRAIGDLAISVFGWLFASLMLLLFLSVLVLGCQQAKPPGALLISFAIGFLACVGVFGKMWLAYQEYGRKSLGVQNIASIDGVERPPAAAAVESIELFGPFPAPTTWMLFGVAFAPLVFMFIYMYGFHRWLGDTKPLQGSAK